MRDVAPWNLSPSGRINANTFHISFKAGGAWREHLIAASLSHSASRTSGDRPGHSNDWGSLSWSTRRCFRFFTEVDMWGFLFSLPFLGNRIGGVFWCSLQVRVLIKGVHDLKNYKLVSILNGRRCVYIRYTVCRDTNNENFEISGKSRKRKREVTL